jgi:hypothetical protein
MTPAAFPSSLPPLSRWLLPATVVHTLFVAFPPDLPSNRVAIPSKSTLVVPSPRPAAPNHRHLTISSASAARLPQAKSP